MGGTHLQPMQVNSSTKTCVAVKSAAQRWAKGSATTDRLQVRCKLQWQPSALLPALPAPPHLVALVAGVHKLHRKPRCRGR